MAVITETTGERELLEKVLGEEREHWEALFAAAAAADARIVAVSADLERLRRKSSEQHVRATRERVAADLETHSSQKHREWLERKLAEERVRLERDRTNVSVAAAKLATTIEEAERLARERESQLGHLEEVEREITQVDGAIEMAQGERDRLLRVEREFEQIEAAMDRFGHDRAVQSGAETPSAAHPAVNEGLDEAEVLDPLADTPGQTRPELDALLRQYRSGGGQGTSR